MQFQPRRHHQEYSSPQAQAAPTGRIAANSVQDAHRLLAVYPFASATPTAHIARHLNSLSISSVPPSYVQSLPYGAPAAPYPQPHFPVSSEYANELNHLAARSAPTYDGGYWESTRNDAVRYLGDQGFGAYPYYPPQATAWSQPYPHASTYQTPPFAQSVFQHSTPSAAYPTPPPPGISMSSSSLANALGEPIKKPAKTVYKPEESAQFFSNYIAQTSAEIDALPPSQIASSSNTQAAPSRSTTSAQERYSPDPLALEPSSSPVSVVITQTPRKRKDASYLDSPSAKRRQISEMSSVSPHAQRRPIPAATLPLTPSSKSQGTPTSKRRLQPYVALPPLPRGYLTPSRRRDRTDRQLTTGKGKGKGKAHECDDSDDLGGFGSIEDELSSLSQSSAIKSTGKRATGDRDDRAPIDKLTTFLEDIFEAEDSLPPDATVNDLSAEFFSPLTIDGAHPLLHPNVIRKLSNLIAKVGRPMKRLRLSSRESAAGRGTPRAKGRIAEIDTSVLSRMLKILDRSVKAGEDVNPFVVLQSNAPVSTTSSKTDGSPKKTSRSKKNLQADGRRSKSKTPADSAEDGVEEHSDTQETTEADCEMLTRDLDIARDSVLAADCCIALLSSDRLTKQLYSEELITACLNAVKNQLTKVIYPFVEASANAHGQAPMLRHLVLPSSRDSSHRRQLAELFHAISSVIPRISELICADTMAMSEAIIIQAVYIAIGPFFVVESDAENEGKGKKESAVLNTLGASAMRGLRLDALSLVRGIFSNHEDQRSWIIEEILSSLIRLSDTKQKAGQFRLRDGRSIRTVSALLMQLVQTSAHDVRVEARSIKKARQQALAIRRQEFVNDNHQGPFLDEKDMEETRLYTSGLDSATKAAKTIIVFLTQRSGKSKVTKNSNEAEYRAIFDNLISDLLTVLFWPEWPAASILLSIICKFLVSSLDDVKTTSQNDNNAMKTMALDHLGVVAARLRSSVIKFQDDTSDLSRKLRPLDEIMCLTNIKQLQRLTSAHQDLASHLCKRSSEDQAYESARELTAVVWGQELAFALQQCGSMLTDNGEEEFDPKADRTKVLSFGEKVKDALRNVWDDTNNDVFDDSASHEEVTRIDRLSEEIGTIQSFKNSFSPILNVVLQALDAPPVFMRTKALKALGQIVTSDPSILSTPNVRRAIESHLLDSSPAVRDAAVELIGRYMIDSPKFAADYYQRIAERIADTGLGVRKRVIRLLKSFYTAAEERSRRIDICIRIVLRMGDEDDTVKDLAIKTMEELWFQDSALITLKAKTAGTMQDKSELLSKVTVIMGVSGFFKDRHSPLEDLLHQVIASKEGNEASMLHKRYAEICEALIDGLVDASDLPGFTVISCVRTICLFTSAYPAVLSGSNASTLLPYLKNATTPEEQMTSDYLLRIFRASIPHIPRTAAKLAQELQLALQPMVLKPSSAAGMGLQETVACMCAVVRHLTHDFSRLVALLRSCNARLKQSFAKPASQPMPPQELRSLTMLLSIVSLLCEHCSFDQIRMEHENLRAEIDSITKGSIIEHVYGILLDFYGKYREGGLRARILHCLGFLFRAQPALMTADSSAAIMDDIFSSQDEEARGRLLKIIQDFLISEASKHAAKEKASAKAKSAQEEVNMEELVGNTDGFADSGVSSAVVQRYLDPILKAALSQSAQIQSAAVDILTFTIKQGLAHPLQARSFPVIVALETSANNALSTRASALHTVLHSKHTSLLNARYVVSARASFDYQRLLLPGQVQGYRMIPGPTALLQRWYALVREKRATRQDFVKALVKVFDIEQNAKTSQDDVEFVRYMAENFAAFEYKTQEEVLTVLKYLTAVLSTTGMQLVETFSPSHLLTQLHGSAQSGAAPSQDQPMVSTDATVLPLSSVAVPTEEKLPLMRTSVVVAMIMLLKAHLKALYGISEEKCSKWVVGRKSAVGDRPATRRHERPLLWERLPFATMPLLTSMDVDAQKTKFLEIWNEDGLTAEPEDDLA
ncbi:hypothetical protein WOLCODRAFT_67627 [Wolfiporia cocos MD-104 SS10]|uniref:Sister chromatid cohesion protein n=1 Tax=Wolfiporia cocos (strain MD-104) TaxID=742152 RepID=A0A2H3JND7_WOLCO|nr:hypothetical protein WOLCODRAFT_67627 [Wolfiporia cocos MD-104 SS10]